jgi:hypothetical protein
MRFVAPAVNSGPVKDWPVRSFALMIRKETGEP